MGALYALRFCLHKDVKDVKMGTNVEGFGAFDDLILRVEYRTEKPKLYLIQLKHKEKNNYCIKESDLNIEKNNNMFFLKKYKNSYEAVLSKLEEEDNPFMKNISEDDVHTCLVTNANLQNVTKFSLESTNVTVHLKSSDPDLIDTKSGNVNSFHIANPTTTAQIEYSTFFRYFRFYDRQANYKEAKEEVKLLLKTRFGMENSEVAKKVIKFIKRWPKEHVLTKEIIMRKLLELLTGITDERRLFDMYKVFENITDINDREQRIIMLKEIQVSLQGKSPDNLYKVTNQTFHETVPGLFLLKNIKKTVNVGSEGLAKPEKYINRRFYKILLDKRVLLETKKNIFLFHPPLPTDLNGRIEILTDLEPYSRFTDSNVAIVVSEDEFTETITRIKEHEDLKSYSLHHVSEYNVLYLEWQCSCSNPENLLKFMVYEDSVNEQEVLQYFKSNLNIVSTLPGMGKTTILNTLARNCRPDVLALRLDLNTHEEYLKNENSELRQNPLKYILEKALSGKNREFESKLFEHLKEENRLILFVDAFDEISPTHTEAVLSIIEKLKESQISMWIFTRLVAQTFLQKHFSIIPINMVPFTNDEIHNYLLEEVGQERNEDVISFLSKNLHNLCNVPLYLYMLRTIISERRLNFQDLKMTDLYDSFIGMSCQKHIEKRIIGNKNCTLDFLKCSEAEYLRTHKTSALIVIFGKEYLLEKKIVNEENLKSINDLNTGRKNYELIVAVDDETPRFFHETYTEYFAALGIYEYLQKEKFYMLYELLFKEKYKSVRVMFDRIAAKELPSHLAVVEKDVIKLKALCDTSLSSKVLALDNFKRTVLHFAMNSFKCSYKADEENCVPNEIIILLIQRLKNEEAILKQCDCLMNLNFYEHAKKLENVSLLHMAAYCGDIYIVEYVLSVHGMHEDINKLECGNAAIHYAARNGFAEIIQLLRRNGANIDEINDSRMTALHEAILSENEECVELLIKEGADVNRKEECPLVPLLCAAQTGNTYIIKLLINADVIDDIDHDGMTALHHASQCGHEDSVNCFITYGSDVNKTNNFGQTPMHCAAQKGHLNIIKLLKKMSASTDFVDTNGMTVLQYAYSYGYENCIEYLINEGD